MTRYLKMVLVQRITKMSKQFYFLKFAGRLLNICGAQKNILLFPEMRVTRKFFTRAASNFNRFSEGIFFSSLVSFAFFCIIVFSFTCLFVFLNQEKYFLMHVIYVLNLMVFLERSSKLKLQVFTCHFSNTMYFGQLLPLINLYATFAKLK